jgi:hypothetical protein
MDCEACERLHAEAAKCWQDYLTAKHFNQARTKHNPARDFKRQQELLRIYKLAAARQRVHQGEAHPGEGRGPSPEDIKLVSEAEGKA